MDAANFIVPSEQGTTFLKLYFRAEVDVAHAAEATRRAGELGVGPRLRQHSTEHRALLQGLLGPEWQRATLSFMDEPDAKAEVLAALRRWHASGPLGWVAPFEWGYAPTLNAADRRFIEQWDDRNAWVLRIAEALRASGYNPVSLHGDLHISNVMRSESGAVRLVDFDFSRDGDPCVDLATIALDMCELDEDYLELVEAYAGRADPSMVARTKLHAILQDYNWTVLSIASHRDRKYCPQADFLFYGRSRAMRCRHHLQLWDVDDLIRSL